MPQTKIVIHFSPEITPTAATRAAADTATNAVGNTAANAAENRTRCAQQFLLNPSD